MASAAHWHGLLEAIWRSVEKALILLPLEHEWLQLPIAFGLGADGNFRTPLGVSVIGGLITSTLLSLVVVPAAYSLVAEITDRVRARMGWAPRKAAAANATTGAAPTSA